VGLSCNCLLAFANPPTVLAMAATMTSAMLQRGFATKVQVGWGTCSERLGLPHTRTSGSLEAYPAASLLRGGWVCWVRRFAVHGHLAPCPLTRRCRCSAELADYILYV
jgi:hypothetical protein